MSRLIVPAHAKGMSEIEKQIAEARQVVVTGVTLIVGDLECGVKFPGPVPLEGIAAACVQAAFQIAQQKKGEDMADRVLAGMNGKPN